MDFPASSLRDEGEAIHKSAHRSGINRNGWTDERRAKMREAVKRWRPWEKSTGPRTKRGRKKSSANAMKHGYRGKAWRDFNRLMARQRAYVRGALK